MQFVQFQICDFATGTAIPLGKCAVYLAGTSTLAALYDAADSPISNPVTASSLAQVGFATPDGLYDFQPQYPDGSAAGPKILKQQFRDLMAVVTTITPQQFGAIGDGVTDDGAAFLAALADLRANALSGFGYSKGGARLFIPKGAYYLGTSTLDITFSLIIEGEASGEASGPATVLRWAANTTGLRLQSGTTTGASGTQADDGTGAEGTIIRNLGLIGGWTSGDADYHAIHLRTKATIRDLYIERWQGEGIFGNVSIGSGGATEGEANNTEVSRVYIENTRNGLHVAGGDFNAGTFKAIDCKAVRASAIWDEALINNTHIGHHAAACGAAPYRLDKNTARAVLIGCYAESGQPASKVVYPNMVVGGFYGSGFTSDSTGMRISADGGFDIVASSDGKYQLGQTTAALASSGADKILTVHNKAALGASIPTRLSFAMGYEVDGVTPCQLADFYAVTNTSSPSTAEAKARLAFRAYSTGVMTDQIEWDNINFVYLPVVNAQWDLGKASQQWKNLRLSGNVYIAGNQVLTSRQVKPGTPTLTDVVNLLVTHGLWA